MERGMGRQGRRGDGYILARQRHKSVPVPTARVCHIAKALLYERKKHKRNKKAEMVSVNEVSIFVFEGATYASKLMKHVPALPDLLRQETDPFTWPSALWVQE